MVGTVPLNSIRIELPSGNFSVYRWPGRQWCSYTSHPASILLCSAICSRLKRWSANKFPLAPLILQHQHDNVSDSIPMQRGRSLRPRSNSAASRRDPTYETAIQDALDAETAIAEAEAQRETKRVTRDEKVAALVVAGVIGNPEYGSDSDLYGAMGYVRKSQRRSGLTQTSNVPPPTPQPANAVFPRAARKRALLKPARVFLYPNGCKRSEVRDAEQCPQIVFSFTD